MTQVKNLKHVAFEWGARLLSFSYKEAAIQFLTFFSGLIVVRYLPKSDYALYTLVVSMQATTAVLADSGLSNGVSAIGGPMADNRSKLNSLCDSANKIRLTLTLAVCVVMGPLLAYLLIKQGATVCEAVILCCIMMLSAHMQIAQSFYAQFVRLTLQIATLQKLNFKAALIRLSFIATSISLIPGTATTAIANGATLALQVCYLKKWRKENFTEGRHNSIDYKSKLFYYIKRQAPLSIYYCVYGQISVFLLGIFGTPNSVADIGALGRFSLFYSLLASVMTNLIYPRFARITNLNDLPRRYFQSAVFFVLVGSALPLAAEINPRILLSILGSDYLHLQNELTLMLLSALLGNLSGVLWSLNSARGWTVPAPISIGYSIIIQAVLIYFLDVSSLQGVISLSLYTAMASIGFCLVVAHRSKNSISNS